MNATLMHDVTLKLTNFFSSFQNSIEYSYMQKKKKNVDYPRVVTKNKEIWNEILDTYYFQKH